MKRKELRCLSPRPASYRYGGLSSFKLLLIHHATVTAITGEQKLAGIFGLSSYLLLGKKLEEMIPASAPSKDAPIFMGHGDSDPLVRYVWGKGTAEKLQQLGWKVDFRTYP